MELTGIASMENTERAGITGFDRFRRTSRAQIITGKRRLAGFAYGGKLTSIEIGQHITVDLSGSAIYQHEYKKSRCPELNDYSYSKLLYDASLVIYWHPLTSNRYRNFQTGVESWVLMKASNESQMIG